MPRLIIVITSYSIHYTKLYERMISKKIPGAEIVYMVYDNRDRLVLTQDGNMRTESANKYMYTKYDCFNRPVMTGTMVINSSLDNIRTAFKNYSGIV